MAFLPTSWMTFSQNFRRKICLRKNLQKRPLSCLLFVNSWGFSLTVTQFCLPDTTLSFSFFWWNDRRDNHAMPLYFSISLCSHPCTDPGWAIYAWVHITTTFVFWQQTINYSQAKVHFCLTSWKCRHFPEWPMTHSWKSLHFNLRQTKPLTFCQGFSLSVLACSPAGQAQTDRHEQTHTHRVIGGWWDGGLLLLLYVCCVLEVSLAWLVVLAIFLTLSFLVTHTQTNTHEHTEKHKQCNRHGLLLHVIVATISDGGWLRNRTEDALPYSSLITLKWLLRCSNEIFMPADVSCIHPHLSRLNMHDTHTTYGCFSHTHNRHVVCAWSPAGLTWQHTLPPTFLIAQIRKCFQTKATLALCARFDHLHAFSKKETSLVVKG